MSIASAVTAAFLQVASAMNARAGRVGMSAYDQAKQNGFVGTFADWQASLVGQDEDLSAYFAGLLLPAQTSGAASESQVGVTQLATTLEAQAATSTTKALSPARALSFLTAVLPAQLGVAADALALITGFRRGTDAQRVALTTAQVFDGLYFHATDTGITWKYTGGGWHCWDSWWMAQTPMTVQGFAGAYGATNGWVTNGNQYRWVAGQIRMRGNIIVNGAGAVNGQIAIALPATAATPYGTPPAAILDVYRQAQGQTTYLLNVTPSGSWGYLGWQNSAGQSVAANASAPFVWGQSDTIRYDFLYDVA